ncbi:hypothetical protein ACTA71_009262 [Dictyostelium dimigraforme]
MNSIKIKCKESFSSFGSFPKEYPSQLEGNISPNEFEGIINRINSTCKSSFNKLYLLFFIGPIIGIALIIIGIIRWNKLKSDFDDQNDFMKYLNSENDDFMDIKNQEAYKPNKPFFYFVIGIALFLVGIILFGCFYFLFKKKVLGKINGELIIINQNYSQRNITFKMKDEMEKEYIPDFEFRGHRNNQAYMSNVKFDRDGNPYRETQVHYLHITFPISPLQQPNPTPPPLYSINPNGQYFNTDGNKIEMNVIYN